MNYHDRTVKLRRLQQSIRTRKGIIGCGREYSTALAHTGCILYTGANRRGQAKATQWQGVVALAARDDAVVALLSDGTLRATGRPAPDLDFAATVSGVRRVEMGPAHLAVLLGNGRVIVGGHIKNGCGNTENWPPVTDIACGHDYTVGLATDGRVLVAGGSYTLRHTVRAWQNVAGLFTDFAGEELYAITEEGSLLSTRRLPFRMNIQKGLVFVAANHRHLWAITATGRVLSTDPSARRLSGDKQYVACAVSEDHAVVLSRNGEVISLGSNEYDRCNTNNFGQIFSNFSEFASDRRTHEVQLSNAERAYQIALVDATRMKRHLAVSERLSACLTTDGRVLCTGSLHGWRQWGAVRDIACGNAHVLALLKNSRVLADGNHVDGCCDVDEWTGVKAVAAGRYHSIAVLEDGTVRFAGRDSGGRGQMADWTDIRFVRTTRDYTVGVTFQGKIRIAGTTPFAPALLDDGWQGVTDVAASETHLAALYPNGRVRTTRPAMNRDGVDETAGWRRVRAIAAGQNFTIGLCYGGTVLAVGEGIGGQEAVADWHHVVSIGCGNRYAAALTAEGRVLTVGVQLTTSSARDGLAMPTGYKAPETSHWRDIVAIAAGPEHLLGLTKEGQILSVGLDGDSQCTGTGHFSLFRSPARDNNSNYV